MKMRFAAVRFSLREGQGLAVPGDFRCWKYLPKCTSACRHQHDSGGTVACELIKSSLALRQRAVAVDPKWADVIIFQQPFYQIQRLGPTTEDDARCTCERFSETVLKGFGQALPFCCMYVFFNVFHEPLYLR